MRYLAVLQPRREVFAADMDQVIAEQRRPWPFFKRCWAGLRPGSPGELPILGPKFGIDGYLSVCGHVRTGILTSAMLG